jgi:hypothetical protein
MALLIWGALLVIVGLFWMAIMEWLVGVMGTTQDFLRRSEPQTQPESD